MKKMIKLFLSIFVLCIGITLCSCDTKNSGETKEKNAYVSLDINPAIEFIVDQDNKVVSVRGENEDGQVLLYEETDIEGVDINLAIERITNLAVELGYLDENNKVVDTIVTSEDEEFTASLLEKVNTSITATASNLGLTVTTDAEGAYSLLRQMNAFKEKFPNNKAIQNMSIQKFKLVVSASETGEITLEAAVELDDKELISMIKTANAQIEEFATDSYLEAKEKALALYDEATKIAEYGVYTKFYLERVLTHPMTAYYGGVYQMYATAAKSFEVLYKVANLAVKACDYPLNETQIQAIMTSLGMEENEIELLKNSNGDITISSIEAYADKLFKNTPASQELDKVKADLTAALNTIETNIEEIVQELSEEYKPQIEATIASAKQLVESIETMMASLPEPMKVILNNCIKDFKEIVSTMESMLEDGKFNLDDLKEFSEKLDTKAKEYLDKIKEDLSEEELAELEKQKAEAVNKLVDKKKELEAALDQAEQEAKAKLASLKESRKNNNNEQ